MSEEKTRPCRYLRSKGMYIEVEPDPLVPNMSDGFYWCSHTQNCLGPDTQPVEAESCRPERMCYQAS
jgi:hypothetical protein